MSVDAKPDLRLEIAHVLFIDIVGYSKLLINALPKNPRRPRAQHRLQIEGTFGEARANHLFLEGRARLPRRSVEKAGLVRHFVREFRPE